jgi:tetratricopeptide (TPR) repeat protein
VKVFFVDDLAAWLVGVLADTSRRKLTSLILGDEQERALGSAVRAALQQTAMELRPGDNEGAMQLAMAVSEVFRKPVPAGPLAGDATLLETLQSGIAAQLAKLDDASLTGTGQSSAAVLGVPGATVAAELTGHLLQEIVIRGSRGGPLFPLASQLNDDVTHLQGQHIAAALGQLAALIQQTLAQLPTNRTVTAAPKALAQLPPMTSAFTGREAELAVLSDLLDPAAKTAVSLVTGLPGVGKTTLVKEAGHAALRRGWFRGGTLFFDFHGYDATPDTATQALDWLLRSLGVSDEDIPPDEEERAATYRSELAKVGKPVLVVADNASSAGQVLPLLPGAGPHKMIVTSRHNLLTLNARMVDVTTLDNDEAVELVDTALRAWRPDDDRIASDRESAWRLAGLCGGLPLALWIAAALLGDEAAMSASELADELAVESERLERLHYYDETDMDVSVAAAFELSYRKLSEAQARLFLLLSLNPGPDISTASAAVLADLSAGNVREILKRLARAHLVEAAPGVKARWRMHDLIRLFAARLSADRVGIDSREQARGRLFKHYSDMTYAATSYLQGHGDGRRPEHFTGRDESLDWLDAERSNLVAVAGEAVNLANYPLAFDLCKTLVDYLSWRRYVDDWDTVTTLCLKAAQHLDEKDNEAVARDLRGLSLQGMRQFDEAIKEHGAAAAIFQKAGNRYREGRAMYNRGMALEELRRFSEAIEDYERDIVICAEVGDLVGQGITLNALSRCFREENRLEEAVDASRDSVAIHQRTGDRHRLGLALNTLAAALAKMGQLDEGITAGREAVAMLRETRDRYMEGQALLTLGGLLLQAQFFDEGIGITRDAIAVFQEMGDLHAEGDAMNNLGSAFLWTERFDEAVTTYERAAEIARETGDRHSEGIVSYNRGLALARLQRFDEAISAYRDAVAISRETKDRPNEARALYDLSIAQYQTRNFQGMIATSREAAAAFHVTGDRHREGIALNNLGAALMNVGEFREAITVSHEAVKAFKDSGDVENARNAQANVRAAEAAWRRDH